MIIHVTEPNPDGLDEVFNAYHALRDVLRNADLAPGVTDEMHRKASECFVEEAMDMLGAWLSEQSVRGLEE